MGGVNTDSGEEVKRVDFSDQRENCGWRGIQGGYSPHQRVAAQAFQSTQTGARAPGMLGCVAIRSLSRLRPQETWGVSAGVSISQSLS